MLGLISSRKGFPRVLSQCSRSAAYQHWTLAPRVESQKPQIRLSRRRMSIASHPSKMLSSTVEAGRQFKASLREPNARKMGVGIGSCNPQICRQLSAAGYDFVMIDNQHSPLSPPELNAMLSAVSPGCHANVRVAGPDDLVGIQQALDLGAQGIIVPCVNTAEDARKAVKSCFFPPLGGRSVFYPTRATSGIDFHSYLLEANAGITLCIQVETVECVKNLPDIVAVPGIDLVMIGPFDLSTSMCLQHKYSTITEMQASPELSGAIEKVVSVCQSAGLPLGGACMVPENVPQWLSRGFVWMLSAVDLDLLDQAAANHLDSLRTAFADSRQP